MLMPSLSKIIRLFYLIPIAVYSSTDSTASDVSIVYESYEMEKIACELENVSLRYDETASGEQCLALLTEKNLSMQISIDFGELPADIYRAKFSLKAKNNVKSINPIAVIKLLNRAKARIYALYPVYASYFNEINDWQNFDVCFYLPRTDTITATIEWLDIIDLYIDYVQLFISVDNQELVYAVNLQDLNLDTKTDPFDFTMVDRRILLASIQGIINRDKPRLVLLHNYDDYEGQAIYRWLKRFNKLYCLLTYDECIRKFVSKKNFKGCVLFDPGIPDTIAINDPPEYQKFLFQIKAIATNLSALENLLIITPRTMKDVSQSKIPIIYNLTDKKRYRFVNDSTGCEALKFNLFLFQKKKFNKDIIFKLLPYASLSPIRNACEKLTDFTIQNKYWTFYYDLRDTSDNSFLHSKIFSKTHFLMGWPDEGWIDGKRYYSKEYEHIKLASKAGKLWIGDMNRIHNLSFFSRLPQTQVFFIQYPPQKRVLESQIYISFVSMDGDNPVLALQHYAKDWDSPLRGQIPFTWCLPPKLVDIAPAVLQYYYRKKTPNDCFIADVSGLGWHLTDHFDFNDFTDMPQVTARYLKKLDIKIIKLMADRNDDLTDTTYMKKIGDAYPELSGFLEGYWPPEEQGVVMIGGKIPSVRLAVNRPLRHLGDTTDIQVLVDGIIKTIESRQKRPLFLPVTYNIYNSHYTIQTSVFEKLKEVQELLNKIYPDIEYVRLDEMMDLIKQYYER
ncbi:MAG: hypothetical protein ABIL20_00475 [candidate division WOR-3 bacterium]